MSFVVVNGESKSMKELYNSSVKKGAWIAQKTNKKDVVLISKRTSFDQLESFIGCMLFNRIPVIIPHPSTKVFHSDFMQKMKKIDMVVSPKLCISDEEDAKLYTNIWKTISVVKELEGEHKTARVNKKDVAFVQLSSGTTGVPKVIKITHAAVVEQCDEYAARLGLGDNDVIVSWLPLYHDMGLIACFMLPILHNISFVHIHPFEWLSNPSLLFDAVEKYKGTHAWMPNFAFSYMAKRCKKSTNDLSSMKRWISCSEMTHYKDMMSFYDQFKGNGVTKESMQVCYALAENVFAATQSDGLSTTSYDGAEVVSCGSLLCGTSAIIKKAGQNLTSSGQAGNVFLKSSYMAEGIEIKKYGYFKTGDVGFIKDDQLYILGRSDDMINSYGRNIFPYAIEKEVFSIPGIISGRVACFGVFKEKAGTEEVYLVAEADGDVEAYDVADKISKLFDVSARCFIKPRGYIVKTSSGKTSRKSTRDKLLKELDGV